MSVPISTVVNVVVAMPPIYQGGQGFSTLMVLGESAVLPLSVRARAYFSVQSVGLDYSSTSEEYKAALTFFSQNPRPAFIVIGRRVTGPTGGELLGSGNFDSNLAHWKALNPAETLQLTIDGTPVTLPSMNFTNVANLNGVAGVIQTAMLNPLRGTGILRLALTDTDTTVALQTPSLAQNGDSLNIGDEFMTVMDASDTANLVVARGTRGSTAVGHSAGAVVNIGVSGTMTATLTFTGNGFFAKSGSTGATSGIQVTNPTTLSRMLGFDDGTSTAGLAQGESVEDALNACEAATSFYGLVLTRDFTDSDALDASSWAEGHSKLFGHATGDQNAKVAASNSDFPAIAQAMALARTCSAYNDPAGLSDYLMVSALARVLAVDFSQPDSTITLMFRQCPGVRVSNINLNDKRALDGKNCNYYTTFGNFPMFATGIMANGSWIDQRHGLDFLAQHLADAAFSGFTYALKVPQTDKGLAYLTGLLEIAMQDMVRCGLIAPGTWRGTGIGGVVNTGEFLPTGYKIYAAPIASQSEADRMARKAPPITIVAKGAGAIQYVDIFVQFEP